MRLKPFALAERMVFFRLLGERLGESGGDAKTVADAVDGFEVRQLAAEVPALPEEIHRVLGHVMTEVQELL